jgi:hypothetical protein
MGSMTEWSVCLKGEIYLTIQARSKEEAINCAFKCIKEVPGYFKVRETLCESLDFKDDDDDV